MLWAQVSTHRLIGRHLKTGSPFCWREGTFQISGGYDIWYGSKGTEIV